MRSWPMYCQMSISVQLERGKTRMCSPAAVAAVVEAPQLRALVLRIPLAELVAEGEDALLGAGLLLVAAGAAEDGVELVLLDGVQQRRRLQAVARGARALLLHHPARVDGLLHRGHHQPGAQVGHALVAVLDAPRGSCARCPRASAGTAAAPGQNAFSASRSITAESLPPENSSTGRSNSAATSRMMKMDSASRAWR